jgi:hypothetical protein
LLEARAAAYVEVPDDVVFKNFKKRTAECDQAISFRLTQQKNPVSMIKSALIADVEYLVNFDGHIDAQARAKAISDLALELGVKLDSSDRRRSAWSVKASSGTFGTTLYWRASGTACRPQAAAPRRNPFLRGWPDRGLGDEIALPQNIPR